MSVAVEEEINTILQAGNMQQTQQTQQQQQQQQQQVSTGHSVVKKQAEGKLLAGQHACKS
jgi:hypothetical protein